MTISGVPKVLDFGFAQTVDSLRSRRSRAPAASRTCRPSRPAATRRRLAFRSDFSVGVMIWEAVTRRRFWSEEASKATILSALKSRDLPPNRLGALAKSSDELRAMVAKATAPDPADRYATASAFQSDLRVVLNQITPPTFALRDLGRRVSTLFANDRARLQRAIEEDLQAPAARGHAGHAGPHDRGDRTCPRSSPLPLPSLSTLSGRPDRSDRPGEASRHVARAHDRRGRRQRHAGADRTPARSFRRSTPGAPARPPKPPRRRPTSVRARLPARYPRSPWFRSRHHSRRPWPTSRPTPFRSLRRRIREPRRGSARRDRSRRARCRPLQRTSTPPDGDQPLRAPVAETPIHVSDAHPTSGRPPQPIDSVNPYGP